MRYVMSVFRSILNLAVFVALVVPSFGIPVSQTAIFATSFEEDSDANYDLWPDHWTRKTGPEYPHYTKIEITADPTAEQGRSLQVHLDGGGAYLSTPAMPILPKFGYKVHVRAKAENLQYTKPRFVIEFQDRYQKSVQIERSKPLDSDGQWHEIKIDSLRPKSDKIDRAVIYLDAPRERRGDMKGLIAIEQIVVERLPSMVVKTGALYNVYNDFKEVKVECTLSGIREQNPEIRFQLLDETSREIEGKSDTKTLEGRLIVEDSFYADDIVGGIGNRPSGYEGTQYWTPDIDDYGFYKIRVEMLREKGKDDDESQLSDYDRQLEERVITLAVLPKLPRPSHGEFGWTLPLADKPLSFEILADLLPRVGVHWVKMPVWYPADDRSRGEEIIRFAERTSASGIEVVGILDNPLAENWQLRDANEPSDVADLLLTDPSFWQPQFEHVMTRLSLRLRWWQLGNDWDTSFYGYSELSEKILSIRKELFRFGQDVKMGLGWRWPRAGKESESLPSYEQASWEFEQMSAEPPLSSKELDDQMRMYPRGKGERWVLVDPTMDSEFDRREEELTPDEKIRLHENHVREFVRSMVAAKIHGADGIFVANPFTGPEGVMNVDGTPGELLLPWRTTANLLGGCRYLGQLELPGKCVNHVFQGGDGQVVMIVWNETPMSERLYLGEKIECIDVWGKRTPLVADQQGEVTLEVDRNPKFVLGLHPEITEWRMAVQIDRRNIPSVFSRPHDNKVSGINPFNQGIRGTFTIFVPQRNEETEDVAVVAGVLEGDAVPMVEEPRNMKWDILPRRGELTIGPREAFELPIQIVLDDATYGPQPVRIDFVLEADRLYKFSVWRELNVGMGDILIRVATRIDERGNLVVEQRMVNNGERTADFKCLLYAPMRRRKQAQVVMLGPEENVKIYQYPNGEELLGKVLKLRAEEINGHRVLIHRFKAEAGTAQPAGEPVSTPPDPTTPTGAL